MHRLGRLLLVVTLWFVGTDARARDDPSKKSRRKAPPDVAQVGRTDDMVSGILLDPMWAGHVELGPVDPRRQQIAVRGSLAVAATRDKLLIIDASVGEVVRSLDLHAPRPAAPYGVALDGDHAVYATDDGYVAKLGLDGAYAFVERVGTRVHAGPLLLDLEGEGTTDVVVVAVVRGVANKTIILALSADTGATLFEAQLDGAPPAAGRISLARDGSNAFQLFSGGATHRFKLSREVGFTHFLPSPDDPEAEVSELVVAETAGPEFVYIGRSDGGVTFASSRRADPLDVTGVDATGDVIDWQTVSTVSADDVDGDGSWDLLVVRDGNLEAYRSGLKGKLYQRQPFDARSPQHRFDDYILPGPGDNADRFRALPATSFDGFRARSAQDAEPLFATKTSDRAVALQRRPLLRAAQRNSSGEYAHNGAQLFVRSSQGGFEPLSRNALDAAGDIRGLAVGAAHVVIAYENKLAVCDAAVKQCRAQPLESNGRASGVVRGSSEARFWIGTREGTLVHYDVETRRFTRASGVKPLGRMDGLLRVGDSILTSGPHGTTVYAADGVRLRELSTFQQALQQVVQCAPRGTYYARSGGELLEAASLAGPFELVQSQPSAIRAIACDPSGALIVLSTNSGPLALRGPLYFAWPEGLIAVLTSLGVLLFVVSLSYRRPKRDERTSSSAEPVRLGIRADLPLTTLPTNTDSKLRGLVNALVRFIDNVDTQPPITIGIYGPWGSGKSSAMRLVKNELEAKRRYISVWFNPWRFHREKDIAAALLQSVVQEVRERAGLGRINIALQRLVRVPALLKLAWFVPLVGISLHALCYSHMYPANVTLIGQELFSTQLAGSSLLTISGLAGLIRFVQVARKVFKLNPADLLGEKNQEARVDFIRHFSEELAQVLDALPRMQQVVIFVDDLDRCPPNQTLEMLEALQLLTESQRCYFVLGMDQTMVRYAIELKYQSLLALKRDHDEDTQGFGAHYLEKIITLAVHVPLVSADDIEEEAQGSTAQRAALGRDDSKPGSLRRRPSPSQVFLLAWLMLWFLGFSFLFSVSGPLRETQTSTSAAKEPPRAAQVPSVVQLPAAGAAQLPVQSAADLAKNAKERPRDRPPATSTMAAAISTRNADHVYRESRSALFWLLFASFAACATLLASAALLYYRLRSVGPIGSPERDSPEFNAALRVYLAHLPQNPRKLIRSGNVARFMYYLLGSGWPGCSPATFFASLLAEQYLRPIVGEVIDEAELARQVLKRELTELADEQTKGQLARLIHTWESRNVPRFSGTDRVDVRFCQELRSWLRGATTV